MGSKGGKTPLNAANQSPGTTASPSSASSVKSGTLIVEGPPPHLSSTRDTPFAGAVFPCKLDSMIDKTSNTTSMPSGQNIEIATNYVAVKKVPAKLYMYSIEFGKTTALLTAHQIEQRLKEMKLSEADSTGTATEQATIKPTPTQVSARSEKAHIFKQLSDNAQFNSIQWATDFQVLWTLQELPDTALTLHDIAYTKLSGRRNNLDFLSFKFLDELDLGTDTEAAGKLVNHEKKPANQSKKPAKEEKKLVNHEMTGKGASMRIAALNAFISKYVSLGNSDIIPVGPNKFFLKDSWTEVDDKTLHIHQGYFTSIRPGQKNVLLNVNLATSAFIAPMTVAEFLTKARHPSFRSRDLVKGMTVRIAYRREHFDKDYDPNAEENRHRVIAGYGKKPAEQQFELEGSTITVRDYFVNKLGYAGIKYPNLPCISVNIAPSKTQMASTSESKQKKGTPQWILPELLYLDPYQQFGKLLPPAQTEQMIKVALRTPADTQSRIATRGFELLGISGSNNCLKDLGITTGHKLLRILARQVPAPKIKYRGGDLAIVNNASWNLMKKDQSPLMFYKAPPMGLHIYPLMNLVAVLDMRDSNQRMVTSLVDASIGLRDRMQGHGMSFLKNIPSKGEYLDLRPLLDQQDSVSGEERIRGLIANTLASRQHMALVLLSTKNIELYSIIKRVCDQLLGLHTACVVEAKLQEKDGSWKDGIDEMQYSNLSLKFNMKLRGQNHQICDAGAQANSVFKNISEDTIVFGADVSHAGSSMPFTPSVACVVASDDAEFAQFPASMRLQSSGQEIIEELDDMVCHRLVQFAMKRGKLPKRIIFYRDGVGEDQFSACKKEMEKIESGFKKAQNKVVGIAKSKGKSFVQTPIKMDLTFIVVGKRHHTRFFCTSEDQTWKTAGGKMNGNLKPGFVVDTVITRPASSDIKDFFLQSHAAIQGTARSGHYTVLRRGNFSMEQVQKLTHAFTYNYMRATKGVSYAGPAYYADRLCERGTIYLRGLVGGLTDPPIQPSDEERDDKPDGMKRFGKRVAEHLSAQPAWWNASGTAQKGREPNPWHPDFDECMFWL